MMPTNTKESGLESIAVAHVEARAAKIDAAVSGLEREIAALKEYKQRLIADVVTGQRKVA